MSHCKRFQENIHREKDGFLPPSETAELALHLVLCVPCRTEASRLRRLSGLLSEAERLPAKNDLPAGFDARFSALVHRRNAEKAKGFDFHDAWRPVLRFGLAGALSLGVFLAGWRLMDRPLRLTTVVGVSASEADGLVSAAVVSTQSENEKHMANSRAQALLRDLL